MSPTDPGAGRAADGPALLAVTGLRKSFGTHEVLRAVDLTVHTGEVVAIIGASGSGKTTVLRCLNGLEVADAGRVEVHGSLAVDFATSPDRRQLNALRDRSAMVFQHYNLFPHKTVLENVTEDRSSCSDDRCVRRGRTPWRCSPESAWPIGRTLPVPALGWPAAAGRNRSGAGPPPGPAPLR